MTKNEYENFYIIEAKNNFELGLSMGEKFGRIIKEIINEHRQEPGWSDKTKRARKYINITKKHFPQYFEELEGYAKAANIGFLDLWTANLEDEEVSDKCTTIITNGGKLISHNEDWDKDSADSICLLLKTVGKVSIFEIFYFNTLGGNSISINSHGFISTVNSLVHSNQRVGIPRNIICRWLSETKNPDEDFKKLKKLPRGLGYNFNIANKQGKIWNIECTSEKVSLTNPPSPFVHSNHYLSDELKPYEMNNNSSGTFERYDVARSKVKNKMTAKEMIELTNDKSKGDIKSIMNERTIAKVIVDTEKSIARVWMLREKERGWIEYKLNKLLGWR